MIHYEVDKVEKIVGVFTVINTYLDPKKMAEIVMGQVVKTFSGQWYCEGAQGLSLTP